MSTTHSPSWAGLAAPESGDAQNHANGQGIKRHVGGDGSHRTGDGGAAQTSKDFANIAARAARAGCGLYLLESGKYLLTRWSMVREVPSLHAVGQLLDTVGVR